MERPHEEQRHQESANYRKKTENRTWKMENGSLAHASGALRKTSRTPPMVLYWTSVTNGSF